MKKPQRKKFEARLLELRESFLRNYTETTRDSYSDLDDGIQDTIDFATRSYTKEFLLSLSNLERSQLQQVEAALKRVRTTAYGMCSVCEEEIGLKRLNAAPWVDTCITCQEEQEAGSTRTGRQFSMLEEEPDFSSDD
jgi:DnaK suppressor protein